MPKWILLTLFLLPAAVSADRDQERDDLITIIRELELVTGVVERVRERHGAHKGSVVFKYDALQSRLETLRRDIAMHIDAMDRTPRFERFEEE